MIEEKLKINKYNNRYVVLLNIIRRHYLLKKSLKK